MYGGYGNDHLSNYSGTAVLNGSYGYDRYYVSRKSVTKIVDAREKLGRTYKQHGSVSLDGLGLDGASKDDYLDDNVWYRKDIDVKYSWRGGTLTINGNITISDFHNGDLGIWNRLKKKIPRMMTM